MSLNPAAVKLPPPQFRDEQWFVTLKDIVDRLNLGVLQGNGSPAGVVIASVGTLYRRLDGGAGTTLYVKEANSGSASGWVAK